MTAQEIVARRLGNQRLCGKLFTTPEEVVRHFGAMQAQDYYGAKWAVGQRCGIGDGAVEGTFNSGSILRTHLCRPTWHFVVPEDIRWMLALTGPRVQQANAFMYRKLGLDGKTLLRGDKVLARTLEGGEHLDRKPLAKALRRARIDISENRLSHLLMHAELEGVICSGPRKGLQFTYALLEERVPKAKDLDREAALAELTRRYFKSRGPASLQDFAMWSGLAMSDVKKGIAMVGKEFQCIVVNDRDHWYPRDSEPVRIPANTVHLLPNYDEYGIGYKDRSAFHDPSQALAGRNNPVFRHLLLLNGRMVGTWDRALAKGCVAVVTSPFAPLQRAAQKAVHASINKYARFLGMDLVEDDPATA